MSGELALFGGAAVIDRPLQPFNVIGEAEKAAVCAVIDSGFLSGFVGSPGPAFDGGPMVQALEAAWRERFGVRHAISVNSATSGLFAAMGAIGIGPGDEVILPPYTMSATAMAPLIYGGIPVFADIEDETFCIDPDAAAALITPRTRAIVAVNLFGHPAPLARLRALADRHGLYLVEDNAQGPLAAENGRWAGTIGHIGVFSLNRHKHIQTGEGGICCTDDEDLALRLRLIRNHGENLIEPLEVSDIANLIGFNYRLTELSAAVGLSQLRRADAIVGERAARAEQLSAGVHGLDGLAAPRVRDGCRHVYYCWTPSVDAARLGVPRAIYAKALQAEGVPLRAGYLRPLYRLPQFRRRIAIGRDGYPFTLTQRTYEPDLCPVCETVEDERLLVFVVCSYALPPDMVDRVAEAFRKVHAQLDRLRAAARSAA